MRDRIVNGAAVRAFFIGSVLFCVFYFSTWKHEKHVQRAFYYWENDAELTPEEDVILKNTKTNKLYVKFFEVEANPVLGAAPISKVALDLNGEEKYSLIEIVPTVFIRNEVFKTLTDGDLEELADNIVHLIRKKFKEHFGASPELQEIQIDCDWTISTKDKYHAFLKILKSKIDWQLSATLRLYPYKFPDKMGVLPVDRAMLMCYNLLPPLETKNGNSILEIGELEKYLDGAEYYPVPLDVALPVFTNSLVYKNNQFAGIVHLTKKQLKGKIVPIDKFWYLVTADTLIDNVRLEKGDKIKLERVTMQQLDQAIESITSYVTLPDQFTLSLFYLNNKQLEDYDLQEINRLYSAFSR